MFTGIVEEVGEVGGLEARGDSAVLRVTASAVAADLTHGASIAVNGVCLTVTGWDGSPPGTVIEFDVMAETLDRSVIGRLRAGMRVNLERAARVDSRLGGHVVQGHVDGTGTLLERVPGDGWERVRFALPADLSRYVAEKGSIAVDGVSLTVTAVGPVAAPERDGADSWFEVGLIPETLRATILGEIRPGDPVNLEVDVMAKYLARLTERS